MEAKDTVMTMEQRSKVVMGRVRPAWADDHNPRVISHNVEDALFEAQAEISFKEGIKEVVERIDNTGLIEHTDSPLHETGATILDCPACCWYAYKKKWGL